MMNMSSSSIQSCILRRKPLKTFCNMSGLLIISAHLFSIRNCKSADDSKLQYFAFHGNLNADIRNIKPGDFKAEIRTPINGSFVYYNKDLELKIGDEINYWIYVQYDQLGYKSNPTKWTVTELISLSSPTGKCKLSRTKISSQSTVCKESVIFEETFTDDSINTNKWIWEQYIPQEPDFEFLMYIKDDSVTKISNNKLTILPKIASESQIKQKEWDLSEGCTADQISSKRAKCKTGIYLLQNPVISGKLTSVDKFKFVDISIKAKLPAGDWMYPEIYLENVDNPDYKIYIAYSRGNKILTGYDNENIGGSLLFGGPSSSSIEPKRSKILRSYKSIKGVFSEDFHVYRMKWTPESIQLYVDGINYGTISEVELNTAGFGADSKSQTRLVIGVGVGGVNDFPDDFSSGTYFKPWKNFKNTQIKEFYDSRSVWLSSWEDAQMEVEYVKVKSI